MSANTNNNNGNNMIMLTGLWLKKSKKGVSYMSGTMGVNRVLLYKNTNKTKDSAPDYFLYLAPPRGRQYSAVRGEILGFAED